MSTLTSDPEMNVDLVGRVRNTKLPYSKPLLPLMEALVNSIHSIEDAPTSGGEILVRVHRAQRTIRKKGFDDTLAPITSFSIQDNGVGFNDANFAWFKTSDTTQKATRGGRGIGRFIWLKAFSSVTVDSTYRASAGNYMRRRFVFRLSPRPIHDPSVEDTAATAPITIVSLNGFHDRYAKACPRSPLGIAQHIVQHCLDYFVLGDIPPILLIDEGDDSRLLLQDVFREMVASSVKDPYQIGGADFTVTHLLLRPASSLEHRIVYCANRRAVLENRLLPLVSNLKPRLADNVHGDVVYAAYVAAAFLDEHVNQERTDFSTVDAELTLPGELCWRDVESGSVERCRVYLEPYTTAVREAKVEEIREYVRRQAPEFRYLLKHHPGSIDDIAPDLPSEKLSVELYKRQKHVEIELRNKASEILVEPKAKEKEDASDYAKQRETFDRFLEEWNDLGKAELAKYIVHRKATLSLLAARLRTAKDGRYSLEEAVHRIIFPLRHTSDDIGVDQQNLWILDERLSYHSYLASDLELREMTPIGDVDSAERPDLLIFDKAFAAVDDDPPYSSVVVFEFKRPMRDDYTSDKNPIGQVLRYVRRIRSNAEVDKSGRPIAVTPTTPFFCYIVCDLTTKLREQAENANLQLTPDHDGYFGYHVTPNAYIEVISFTKLIRDAQKRNRILFAKLGIHE